MGSWDLDLGHKRLSIQKRTEMYKTILLSLSLVLTHIETRKVRSTPRLVSDESILPHTPDLWKRGLCERVARQTGQSTDGPPECQPVGSKVDCGCGRPSKYPLNGQDCAVWICDGVQSAFNPIGHWTCMGFC